MLIKNYSTLYIVIIIRKFFILSAMTIAPPVSSLGGELVGQACVYSGSSGDGKLKLGGECQLINQCAAAVSNLRAGLNPQPCRPKGPIHIICCPREERISELMCKEYQEVLKSPWGPLPLLPLNILKERTGLEDNEIRCEPPRPDPFIVNGQNAAHGEFPHMAALGYGNESDAHWYCGGTLISEDYVLTAAHCINHPMFGPVQRVMLGALKLSEDNDVRAKNNGDVMVIDVVDRVFHPKYKSPLVYYDIALLKLKSRVNLTRAVRPACLPQPKTRPEKVSSTLVTGWGRIEYGGDQSDILQKVDLKRTSQPDCERLFNNLRARESQYPDGVQRTQFCAGSTTDGKDSCQGDSGGPLTITRDGKYCVYYVTGIVSFGDTCGIKPGIYTNVQSYLDWIEDIVWLRDGSTSQ